jgi:hypothetical protein
VTGRHHETTEKAEDPAGRYPLASDLTSRLRAEHEVQLKDRIAAKRADPGYDQDTGMIRLRRSDLDPRARPTSPPRGQPERRRSLPPVPGK